MSSGQVTPPGWYADPWPGPPGGLRWWDGSQWTSATTAPGQGPTDAGWWRRAGAYLIDGFIVGAASYVVGLPGQVGLQRDLQVEAQQLTDSLTYASDPGAAMVDYWSSVGDAYLDRWFWLILLPVLFALAYHLVMLRTRSATVGKRALRLRVVPAGGEGQLSWSMLVRRFLTQFAPGWLIVPVAMSTRSLIAVTLVALAVTVFQLLDHLWAASDRKRAIHDLAAGTRVLQDP